ncbi:hypothetical protein [Celerinatantimonas sp. YJH-8]|uniref:hypothetical protein n=1 Tax=Celerinatantimonas sp. YJH-8 TaxID=3228714 RepID=UPI0038C14AB0
MMNTFTKFTAALAIATSIGFLSNAASAAEASADNAAPVAQQAGHFSEAQAALNNKFGVGRDNH